MARAGDENKYEEQEGNQNKGHVDNAGDETVFDGRYVQREQVE